MEIVNITPKPAMVGHIKYIIFIPIDAFGVVGFGGKFPFFGGKFPSFDI